MSSFFRPNFRLSLSLSLSKKKINAAEARHRALLQNGPNDDWQKWLPANWRSLPQYKIYKGAPYCGPCRFWDSKVGAPAGDESACRCEWFIFSSTFFFFFFFFQFLVFLHARAALPSPLHPSSTLHGRCRSSLLFALAGAERAQS